MKQNEPIIARKYPGEILNIKEQKELIAFVGALIKAALKKRKRTHLFGKTRPLDKKELKKEVGDVWKGMGYHVRFDARNKGDDFTDNFSYDIAASKEKEINITLVLERIDADSLGEAYRIMNVQRNRDARIRFSIATDAINYPQLFPDMPQRLIHHMLEGENALLMLFDHSFIIYITNMRQLRLLEMPRILIKDAIKP